MAKTNSKYFTYRKNLAGVTSDPTPVKILIDNSTTVKLGQVVRVNQAGFIVPAGVTAAVLGVVAGFIDQNGTPVDAFSYDTSKTGHTNSGDDTIVTASDNRTRAFPVYAEVEVALQEILYFNVASAAQAQTNLMQFFNLVSTSDQIDQSSASDTSGQFQLIQLDPDGDGDLTKGLYRVSNTQLSGAIAAAPVNVA